MKCPRCNAELGEGLLPARCPSCGQRLRESGKDARAQADRALASRKSVEGLSGMGAGRRSRNSGAKRGLRVFLGFALVVVFCALVFVVGYRAEVFGGRSVPNVVGWSQAQAEAQLEKKGFSVGVNEIESAEQVSGRVVSTTPAVGSRVAPGSTVTLNVAVSSGASAQLSGDLVGTLPS